MSTPSIAYSAGRNKAFWGLLFLILIVGFESITCQTPGNYDKLRFENYTVDDGLILDNSTQLFRDKYGYLWLGASTMQNFNGYTFNLFPQRQNDTINIQGSTLEMAEDSVGDLWIGSYGSIMRYYYKKNYFKNYSIVFDKEGMQVSFPSEIRSIFTDIRGDLWAFRGIAMKFNRSKDQFEKIELNPPANLDPNIINSNGLFAEYHKQRDEIYISLDYHGLLIYSISDNTSTYIPDPGEADSYRCIFVDSQGIVWLGMASTGLRAYNPSTNTFTLYGYNNTNTDDHTTVNYFDIRDIDELADGRIVIGTDAGGLNVFNPETKLFDYYLADFKDDNSILTNGTHNLTVDSQGMLWILCFDGGISYYDPNWKKFEHYKRTGKHENELTDNSITWFAEDNNHNVWLTTKEGGLNYWNRKSDKFFYTEIINPLTNNAVYDLNVVETDLDGNTWVGSNNDGLFKISPDSQFIEHFYPSNIPGKPSGSSINGIVTDVSNRVWVSYNDGKTGNLDYYEPGADKFTHFDFSRTEKKSKVNLQDEAISRIALDTKNHLWIGFKTAGLGRIDLTQQDAPFTIFKLEKSSNPVIQGMFDDFAGNQLILNTSTGLYSFDYATESINNLSEKFELLRNKNFASILRDSAGYFWLTHKDGLIRMDSSFNKATLFTSNEGIQGSQFYPSSKLITSDGEFLLGGSNGFNKYVPSEIKENDFLPPVYITKLDINGNEVTLFNADTILSKDIKFVDSIRVNYTQNTLTFNFVGLNFTRADLNKYRYKMIGLQKNWTEIGSQREVSFTNLPSGKYTFMVQASNNDGIWNPTPASIYIRLLPPWWRTWWFYTILALMGLSAIIIYLKIRDNEQKRDQKLIQEEIDKGKKEIEEQKNIVKELESELKEKEKAEFELRWQNKGVVRFGEIINNSRENIDSLLTSLNQSLFEYLEVEHTAFYLKNDETEYSAIRLILKATTQEHSKKDINHKSFFIGEGLPGTCFHDRELIQVDNLPGTYTYNEGSKEGENIDRSSSAYITMVPLKQDEFLEGVIEIYSAEKLPGYKIEFLEKITQDLTATIVALRTSSNIEDILKKANEQRVSLEEQEKQLTEKLNEIRIRHEVASKKEEELLKSIKQQEAINIKYKQILSE